MELNMENMTQAEIQKIKEEVDQVLPTIRYYCPPVDFVEELDNRCEGEIYNPETRKMEKWFGPEVYDSRWVKSELKFYLLTEEGEWYSPPSPKFNFVPQAMTTLTTALREDEDYYTSWQANIAMAFKDEFDRHDENIDRKKLHLIGNNAAKNFLNLLIRD